MKQAFAALFFAASLAAQAPPKTGPVPILKASELKPGMQATAWTVFEGTQPEAVPIEIIGLWKNAWGPKQDVILGKMGGRAQRTNVAGGMSGSPVYIDGKLIGAVALRMSVFSPDAICGITPIELMLEINEIDESKPPANRALAAVPSELMAQAVAAGASPRLAVEPTLMTPIETPLTFSGFHESTLREFSPLFRQLGATAVMGGAGGAIYETKPAKDWATALQPGQVITGVLVSGDMSVQGLGTVTYNDGKRVLGFGHPFFNLGPVDMPMSRGEILMVLSSAFQPNKFGNATEIVGALKQDRHSGIMGVLGEESPMIPVTMKVRSYAGDTVREEKAYRFNVFSQQKWTPYLMMVTLFNSIQGINDYAEESTYRLTGTVQLEGGRKLNLQTMQAPSEMPMPAPMLLAGWWGDKFNRLYLNPVELPKLKQVEVIVDLLPERRTATIENAWVSTSEAAPGDEITVKAFLRPYRGERVEREFKVKLPAGLAKGDHRILLSDADTLNRMQQGVAMTNRFLDLPQTISLINQERANNKLYVSLVEQRPTVYADDKTMPGLPGSVLNVMQTGRTSNRMLATSFETAREQMAIPFEQVITGSYSLRLTVK
jgi:hypothetical protein